MRQHGKTERLQVQKVMAATRNVVNESLNMGIFPVRDVFTQSGNQSAFIIIVSLILFSNSAVSWHLFLAQYKYYRTINLA
jgi:hypothetical protein